MKQLKRGSLVVDKEGNRGVVVEFQPTIEGDECDYIRVWQIDQIIEFEYSGHSGNGNCLHYDYSNWRELLTILEE